MASAAAVACAQGPAPAADQDIPDEVVRKVDPSVVAIQHERAGGSGFVVSEDGYILTNGHVVRGSDEEDPTQPAKAITVILHDEQKYPARVLGFSMDPDVALIKIDAPIRLRPVEFADSRSAHVGQQCFAVGTPVGLKRTFTRGILSNVERTDLGTETKVFQTDAAINPGNSGGPLFDRNGRVLGINTYAGRGNNIGFTIPIHVAAAVRDHLRERGRFVRALVPLFITNELYDELARSLGVDKGVLIAYVMPGSPAEKAGLRDGDILVEVDGRPCSARTKAELTDFEWKQTIRKPGEAVAYTVLRGPPGGRERLTVRAELEAMEPLPEMGKHAGELVELRYGALGLGVVPVVRLHQLLHSLPEVKGVLVRTAVANGPAAKAGLRPLDVITHVAGKPVANVEAFARVLEPELEARTKAIELTTVRGRRRLATAMGPYYDLRDRKALLVAPAKDADSVDLLRRELLAEGAAVTLAGPGRHTALAGLKGGDYDVVLFAGGAGGRGLRTNDDALRIAREAHAAERILGAVGPSALVPVLAEKALLGKKMTTSKEDSAEAVKAGANYTGKDVESDGRLVTTTGFDRATVRDFLRAIKRAVWNRE